MVMVPGLGDDIQAIKAGIMEIGDIFVVNKADRDGAQRTAVELEQMLDFRHDEGWRPPVMSSIASQQVGIEEIIQKIQEHMGYLKESETLKERRRTNLKSEIIEIAKSNIVAQIFNNADKDHQIDVVTEKVLQKEIDPYTASEDILKSIYQ